MKFLTCRAVLLSFLVSLSSVTGLQAAQAQLQLSADKTSAAVGENITISCAVTGAPTFVCWGATVLLPATGFTVVSQSAGSAVAFVPDSRITVGASVRFGGYSAQPGFASLPGGDHVLGRVTIRASAPGTYTISAPAYGSGQPHGGILLEGSRRAAVIPLPASGLVLTITGDGAPTISQPVDRTIRVGQTATFSVNATGTPAPTIHWQRSPDGANWSTISGATSASYVTPIASLSDHQARFRAVATNSVGNVTSMPAKLTVRRRGDANLDGAVDILDLIVIRRAFGTPTATADLNEDGTVDILDLILVRREFGL